jgi:hypothetical protein
MRSILVLCAIGGLLAFVMRRGSLGVGAKSVGPWPIPPLRRDIPDADLPVGDLSAR